MVQNPLQELEVTVLLHELPVQLADPDKIPVFRGLRLKAICNEKGDIACGGQIPDRLAGRFGGAEEVGQRQDILLAEAAVGVPTDGCHGIVSAGVRGIYQVKGIDLVPPGGQPGAKASFQLAFGIGYDQGAVNVLYIGDDVAASLSGAGISADDVIVVAAAYAGIVGNFDACRQNPGAVACVFIHRYYRLSLGCVSRGRRLRPPAH